MIKSPRDRCNARRRGAGFTSYLHRSPTQAYCELITLGSQSGSFAMYPNCKEHNGSFYFDGVLYYWPDREGD